MLHAVPLGLLAIQTIIRTVLVPDALNV
jgi:hypothetical protein